MKPKQKCIKDIEACIDYQLNRLKKEYQERYGNSECSKRDDAFLQGAINTLAWVKIFAIRDLDYNPTDKSRCPLWERRK